MNPLTDHPEGSEWASRDRKGRLALAFHTSDSRTIVKQRDHNSTWGQVWRLKDKLQIPRSNSKTKIQWPDLAGLAVCKPGLTDTQRMCCDNLRKQKVRPTPGNLPWQAWPTELNSLMSGMPGFLLAWGRGPPWVKSALLHPPPTLSLTYSSPKIKLVQFNKMLFPVRHQSPPLVSGTDSVFFTKLPSCQTCPHHYGPPALHSASAF